MSCSGFGVFRSEQAWILARNKNFRDTAKYEEVKTIANEQFGYKLDGLIKELTNIYFFSIFVIKNKIQV